MVVPKVRLKVRPAETAGPAHHVPFRRGVGCLLSRVSWRVRKNLPWIRPQLLDLCPLS